MTFQWFLKGGDVTKCDQEQDNNALFIADGDNLFLQPDALTILAVVENLVHSATLFAQIIHLAICKEEIG